MQEAFLGSSWWGTGDAASEGANDWGEALVVEFLGGLQI